MKKILMFLVIILGFLVGCDRVQVPMYWMGMGDQDIYCDQWFLVRQSDSRIMAEVAQYREYSVGIAPRCSYKYTVYHNGRSYGEFIRLDVAKNKALDVVNKYGEDNY